MFNRPRRTRAPITLALLVSIALVASQAARAVQRPSTGPARIISFIPAVTEMLFAIGAGPQVIAVGSFDQYPPEVRALPRVGALVDPDLERILSLKPDLVVVYESQTDFRRQLDRAGVPQFVYQHRGLADITRTMRELGRRTDHADGAERAARTVEAALAAIGARVEGRPRPSTLVVFGREAGALRGIFASGGIGFLHDMVEVAGGRNVFADVERQSIQATTELILARRPDVILELRGSGAGEPEARAERDLWNILSSVPAVRTGRVYLIADERTVVPGPRVAEGTELLARALHPEAFR
jgi:iron complex transport system substrate-binding protein